ncbi:MAG: glycosyltransferase family 2 protein [Clostridia bacterium]|nr:glycosyltransferase family 2 protein [Clostridia bacterium]
MKTLSISVAAYNMEKLIRQNLDSFVNSSVCDDIEVLVVNDGSKDGTAQIAAEYEAKYPGVVKLINQENAGPGSTVNRGIEHASGRYFRMVDADDWVGDGFDEYVSSLRSFDADMIVTNYICVDDKTGQTQKVRINGLKNKKTVDFESVCSSLSLEMHAVTFKTDILKQNNIRLFNGFYTDIQYLLFPSQYVKTVMYIDCDVYMYRVSLSGQSMSVPSMQRNIKMHDDMLFSIAALYNSIKDVRPPVAQYVLKKLIYISGTQLGTLLSFEPSRDNKKRLFDYIMKLKAQCPDAYVGFCRYKTAKALRFLNGAFYPLISRMHRKRLEIEK